MLIVIGYFVAKMFSKKCNGFSVGGQTCNDFLSRVSSNCGDNPSDPSESCCNIILNENNCNIETLDNPTQSNIYTAQTTCNSRFPSRFPRVKTCRAFESDCPRGTRNNGINVCYDDECTIQECCSDKGFFNNFYNGTCEPRSDVSVSESERVDCSNFGTPGECIGRMGELYNSFNAPGNYNALYQCQWSNTHGTGDGTFEDLRFFHELFLHGH